MPFALNAQRPGTRANGRNVFWNSFQWADDISLTKGTHTLQFGALVERMQDNSLLSGQHNGSFKFSSLSDFLTNRPRNFIGFVPIPIPVLGTRCDSDSGGGKNLGGGLPGHDFSEW